MSSGKAVRVRLWHSWNDPTDLPVWFFFFSSRNKLHPKVINLYSGRRCEQKVLPDSVQRRYRGDFSYVDLKTKAAWVTFWSTFRSLAGANILSSLWIPMTHGGLIQKTPTYKSWLKTMWRCRPLKILLKSREQLWPRECLSSVVHQRLWDPPLSILHSDPSTVTALPDSKRRKPNRASVPPWPPPPVCLLFIRGFILGEAFRSLL